MTFVCLSKQCILWVKFRKIRDIISLRIHGSNY
uniref:Defective in cullin neddylation protein n=1 Tax=Rhizophora mucronata TaxID=61149 RepID=A0A2P2ITF2_RHIMU